MPSFPRRNRCREAQILPRVCEQRTRHVLGNKLHSGPCIEQARGFCGGEAILPIVHFCLYQKRTMAYQLQHTSTSAR